MQLLETPVQTAGTTLKMLVFSVLCVSDVYNVFFLFIVFLVCPDDMFECKYGRTDGLQPSCISAEQRCDNVSDCLGGEDELEYNCPCGPEGAVRLVDGIVPHQGRLEYCKNGRWTSVCYHSSHYWRYGNAPVICRQLGFPTEGMYYG